MPNNRTDIQGQTILELCEQRGVNIESARIALSRMYKSKGIECSFDRYRAATQEEYDTIQCIKATRKQTATITPSGAAKITFEKIGTIATKTHTPKAAPVKKSIAKKVADLGLPAFDTVLRWAIVIFEMGLMCYSMHLFFGSAGILAGIVMALFTLQGMILAGKQSSWMSADIFMFGYFVFCSFGVYLNKQTFTQTFIGASVDGGAEYLMWALSAIVGFSAYMSAWTSRTVTNETAE